MGTKPVAWPAHVGYELGRDGAITTLPAGWRDITRPIDDVAELVGWQKWMQERRHYTRIVGEPGKWVLQARPQSPRLSCNVQNDAAPADCQVDKGQFNNGQPE